MGEAAGRHKRSGEREGTAMGGGKASRQAVRRGRGVGSCAKIRGAHGRGGRVHKKCVHAHSSNGSKGGRQHTRRGFRAPVRRQRQGRFENPCAGMAKKCSS